jgi:hypothetical protein
MKAIWIVSALAMSLGLAMGLRGWASAAISMKVDLVIAVYFFGMLLVCLWNWNRAAPDSPDRRFMSTMMMLSAALLLGAMPRVLWPEGGWPRMAGSTLALCATIGILIRLLRQRRRHQTS